MIFFLLLLAIPVGCAYAGIRLFAFAWQGLREPAIDKGDIFAPVLKAALGAMLLGAGLYTSLFAYTLWTAI